MYQLVYISTATSGVSASDVSRILAASRINNTKAGITGILYHDGVRFMQALEGHEEAVMRTYERISQDARHRALVMLSRRAIEAREFGQWAMASRPFGTATDQEIINMIDALVAGASPAVRGHFEGFARLRAA